MNWDDLEKLEEDGQIFDAVDGHKISQVAIFDNHVIIHWLGNVTMVYLVRDGKILDGQEVEDS